MTSGEAGGPLIELRDVTRSFTVRRRAGRMRRRSVVVRAVDAMSLTIGAGETVGYLGPNGAGKSTTVKLLTGILVPTEGTVRVGGLDPVRHRVTLARRFGVVFGQRTQLWWDLPLRDSLALLQHVYGVEGARHRRNVDTFIEVLDLGPFLDTPVRQLSLGQRVRGDLAAALLHDPEIVYLDEPTIGLDVVSKARVRTFLAEVCRERGVTLLLSSHDLADVERLCSRLVVIDHGRVVCDGSVDEVRRRFGDERTVIVDLEDEGPPLDVPGAEVVRVEGARQWLRFRPSELTAAAVVAAVVAQARVVDLAVREPDIEDVIARVYRSGG